ncbi:MAG: ABC transporter ATP-binding protein [bacterium]|nr:ABC transporter ATP-binding protein [bacterium]
MSLLKVEQLTKHFGGIQALKGMGLSIEPHQIVGLIGPNGAGKTTFFNCLTGVYRPDQGGVELSTKAGTRSLVGLRPDQVNRAGLARTFQNIRLFGQMRVVENVLVGRHGVTQTGFLGALLRTRAFVAEERANLQRAYELLELVGMADQANRLANNLSYADQRRLEIARALATEPRLLLLDEPAAGMNPTETALLDRLILKLRDELGLSILLIEHDMKLVMNLCDRVLVMDQGRDIAFGTPAEVQSNPAVVAAYLGEESHA